MTYSGPQLGMFQCPRRIRFAPTADGCPGVSGVPAHLGIRDLYLAQGSFQLRDRLAWALVRRPPRESTIFSALGRVRTGEHASCRDGIGHSARIHQPHANWCLRFVVCLLAYPHHFWLAASELRGDLLRWSDMDTETKKNKWELAETLKISQRTLRLLLIACGLLSLASTVSHWQVVNTLIYSHNALSSPIKFSPGQRLLVLEAVQTVFVACLAPWVWLTGRLTVPVVPKPPDEDPVNRGLSSLASRYYRDGRYISRDSTYWPSRYSRASSRGPIYSSRGVLLNGNITREPSRHSRLSTCETLTGH